MKKVLNVVLVLILSTSLFAQKTEVVLTPKVSVVFPLKAEKMPAPNESMIMYATPNEAVETFTAISFDLSSMGVTAEMVAGMGDMISSQMKSGIVAQLKGASVVKDEKVTFKGKEAIYLEIDGKNAEAPAIKGKMGFCYVFFIDATMYNFTFYTSKVDAKLEDGKAFFDSVKIN